MSFLGDFSFLAYSQASYLASSYAAFIIILVGD